MAELFQLRDNISECQTVSEVSLADQASILKQENEHNSMKNQAKEKIVEQAKLTMEIEALKLKLSLMQKKKTERNLK